MSLNTSLPLGLVRSNIQGYKRKSSNKGSSFFANETRPIMKSTAALGAELERKGALNKRWI